MITRNPWLGIASYDVPKGMEEDYLFCGRDEETMDIVRLIDNNLFVTLYGSSGIGKTSLLKAGVIPILKRKDYFPLYVRLSQESNEISYAEAIVRHLKSCGLTEESLVALEHADGNDRLFLWNYFATTRFLDAEGREIYPVIILDQFEEVFRDGDKAKAELLLQQIYLLLNDELEMPDAEGYSADTNYRFVASIREDYLFVLEDSIDELSLDLYKSNRYRLRPMKPENARQVVLVPGRDCIEESEKEKVAERVLELAKKPQSDDIDTLLLSLVCAGTFDKKAGEKITFGDLSIWKDNPMQIYYQASSLSFSPDSKFVISSSWDHTTRIWDVETGEEIRQLQPISNYYIAAVYSPDMKTIALAEVGSTKATLCDAETLDTLFILDGHLSAISKLVFSSDGKTIASYDANATTKLWNCETGECLQSIKGRFIEFSPDDRYCLLKKEQDMKTIDVFDFEIGNCVYSITNQTDTICGASFSNDGSQIITVLSNGVIRKWPFPPLQDLIDQTRERFKDRPLTEEERKMYYLE